MPRNRDARGGEDERRMFWEQVRHDLRQPVQSLQLLTQIFARHARGEPAREGAEHMQRVVDDLARMHEALVNIAQLEAGPMPERRWLTLSKVAAAAAQDLAGHAAQRKIDLRLADLNVSLEADEAWLATILRDLLLFALGHCEGGTVTVSGGCRGDAFVMTITFAAPASPDREATKAFVDAGGPERTVSGRLAMGPGYLRHLCGLLGYHLELGAGEPGHQRFSLTLPKRPSADQTASRNASPRPVR